MFIFASVLSVYSRWSLVSGLRPCARTPQYIHRTPLLAKQQISRSTLVCKSISTTDDLGMVPLFSSHSTRRSQAICVWTIFESLPCVWYANEGITPRKCCMLPSSRGTKKAERATYRAGGRSTCSSFARNPQNTKSCSRLCTKKNTDGALLIKRLLQPRLRDGGTQNTKKTRQESNRPAKNSIPPTGTPAAHK